ncbi:MAG TPA: ABC transporter substrate-binding protein [Candidatus Eisenbacteria bacterium]|nr:ABC transporter substrate-binding protein [Candidatus Eisenbacteria bacterium]
MTDRKSRAVRALAAAAAVAWLLGCAPARAEKRTVIAGYFPNLTHAQALIGRENGAFARAMGEGISIDWKVFNAGPSAIEALFAGKLDITYIGPSPAVNAYVKSAGEAVRVVAGAASGGAALVVRADAGIGQPDDFHGKKAASPQQGNTQDVSLRAWLSKNGLKLKDVGGDVEVLAVANADQVTLFLRKELDAAWTVEPWVSTLVKNAGGRVLVDEATLWPDGRYSTALVLVRKKFLDENPDLVRAFLRAHVETTRWIQSHPEEAKKALGEAIERQTSKPIPADVLSDAFGRITFLDDPLEDSIREQARSAYKAGYLKKEPDLSGLFEKALLKEVLAEKEGK